jgi:hypothetical protein
MAISAVSATVVLVIGSIDQAAQVDTQKNELIKFVLSGMNASRQLLRSGIYHASGRITLERAGKPPEGGAADISAAFDFASDVLRFDRAQKITRSIPVLDAPAKNVKLNAPGTALDLRKAKVEMVPGTERGIYIRNIDRCIIWIAPWQYKNTALSTSVAIYPRDTTPPTNIAPFDIRAIGLYFPISLNKNVPYETVYAQLEKSDWKECSRSADGVYRIGRAAGNKGAYHVYWIDEHQGFSPIRMEAYRVPSEGSKATKEPTIVSETTWTNKAGDLWVPLSTRIVDKQGTPGSIDVYELAFAWESANEAIPNSLLTIESIDAPDKTPIYDFRLATPLQIGRVTKSRHSNAQGISMTTAVITGVNVLLILCAIIFFTVRSVIRRRGLRALGA